MEKWGETIAKDSEGKAGKVENKPSFGLVDHASLATRAFFRYKKNLISGKQDIL